MPAEAEDAPVTVLLRQLRDGDASAADRLIPAVYRELRDLAQIYLRRESPGHTLQPTALVHEAYLRMVGDQGRDWQNRAQFIGVAASVMRRLLIDHARKKRAEKRQAPDALADAGMSWEEAADLLALNVALEQLEQSSPRYARVVELRFFGGLSIDETAAVLQTSPMTVKRDWTAARAWLKGQMRLVP